MQAGNLANWEVRVRIFSHTNNIWGVSQTGKGMLGFCKQYLGNLANWEENVRICLHLILFEEVYFRIVRLLATFISYLDDI